MVIDNARQFNLVVIFGESPFNAAKSTGISDGKANFKARWHGRISSREVPDTTNRPGRNHPRVGR
jgi:hypothetical protein